jgi:hypothetical protein
MHNLIKINFLILSLSFGNLIYAQNTFKGFATAGLTSSQISGDGFYGFGQFGAYAGVGVRTDLSDVLSLSGQLVFNQKGARKYQNNDFTTYRLRVNYVEVPVLVHYNIEKWSVGTGLGFNYRINHRERSMFGDITPERTFKPFEFAFHFMVEYELNENFILGIGYQNSILPVRDHSSTQVFPPNNFILGDWHNNLLNRGQYFTSLTLRGVYLF